VKMNLGRFRCNPCGAISYFHNQKFLMHKSRGDFLELDCSNTGQSSTWPRVASKKHFMEFRVAHFISIAASSVHLDDRRGTIHPIEVTRNETSPAYAQIRIGLPLFSFGCELYGRAKTAHPA
jgi:hypothetical protein